MQTERPKTKRPHPLQSVRAFVSGVQLPPSTLRDEDKTSKYVLTIFAMLMFTESLTPESAVAVCDASRKQLAELMRVSLSTVERRLAEMKAAGTLSIERRFRKSSRITIYKSANGTSHAAGLPLIEPFTSTPHYAWLFAQARDPESVGNLFQQALDVLLALFTDEARRTGVDITAARQAMTDYESDGADGEDTRSPEETNFQFDNCLNDFMKTELPWPDFTQKRADKYGLQRDPEGNGLVLRDGRLFLWQDIRDGIAVEAEAVKETV